ncbi:MAG: hypothetical protein ACHQ1H_12490 [Nitrososphaerales archaeon]
MDEKEIDKSARDALRSFVDALISKMNYASSASDRRMYKSVLENGIEMTGLFEKYLDKLDDYGTPFVRQEGQRQSELINKMKGLETIAHKDLEAAKIQTEFFAEELKNLRDQILK